MLGWYEMAAFAVVRGRCCPGAAALKLPDVGWRHDSGGIPIVISEGGRIATSMSSGHGRVVWTVRSAYQGFLFNVGPRIAKYVKMAPAVEALLMEWAKPAPRPITTSAPKVAPPAKPAEPAVAAIPLRTMQCTSSV